MQRSRGTAISNLDENQVPCAFVSCQLYNRFICFLVTAQDPFEFPILWRTYSNVTSMNLQLNYLFQFNLPMWFSILQSMLTTRPLLNFLYYDVHIEIPIWPQCIWYWIIYFNLIYLHRYVIFDSTEYDHNFLNAIF